MSQSGIERKYLPSASSLTSESSFQLEDPLSAQDQSSVPSAFQLFSNELLFHLLSPPLHVYLSLSLSLARSLAFFQRAIKIQHAAEGEAERKKEEAANERKRKAEESQKWEENREDRVAGELTKRNNNGNELCDTRKRKDFSP